MRGSLFPRALLKSVYPGATLRQGKYGESSEVWSAQLARHAYVRATRWPGRKLNFIDTKKALLKRELHPD